ncbi:ImmA/IrrE family metallo-endopeptidase [Marinimicrobium sp. ABcell2]|uniref:ImmA/IrrE family metallo-endopeptidase n=1 Tax=Marinimicrobium sp. ABcell2 TaxID=3069751 RepID=UPI0027B80EBD|nr:ImmA/IrrE family metallo-endopeptidase [Marinimicrobium sp. ABcell2]MDQ2077484.1 ImmA/IrrE family metallo-endopeptidase [Marinimicrobium sp. ABcell2]
MLRKRGHRVRPLSVEKIRAIASQMRELLSVVGAPINGAIDVVEVTDLYLPKLMDDFRLDIVPDGSMGSDHARTYPDKNLIQVQESVYEGACRGQGRDRFTLAHELGHLRLHRGVTAYARAAASSNHKPYEDSEWQADAFAAELLMPYKEVLQCSSAMAVAYLYGVSSKAAEVRFKKVKGIQ